ncbi:MAG: hypothetical protein ACYC2O_08660 [Microthrixaceae bacterium]
MVDPSTIAARVRDAALQQPATLGDGDCEALRPGPFGQPMNTLSSMAYLGTGAWLASRTARGAAPSSSFGAFAYAASAALAGVGSIAYHGPQFPGAQTLHDLPILGIAGIGLGVPAVRAARGRRALPGWTTRLGVGLAATGAAAGVAYLVGSTSSRCCRPRSLLQWHGLWHVGTAAAMGMWATAVWPTEPDDEEVIDLTGAPAAGDEGDAGAAADR